MHDLHALIKYQHDNVSTKPEFLLSRRDAEKEARNMLDDRAGEFTEDDFILFFRYCNTERVPSQFDVVELNDQDTHRRFNPAFMGKNRKSLLSSIKELNLWTQRLWEGNDTALESLSRFWSHSQVKGAGTSFPSMIMYLKRPEYFNVWLPSLTNGLSILTGNTIAKSRNVDNYLKYNSAVDFNLTKPFGLLPQEIDYLLFCIDRFSTTSLRFKQAGGSPQH